MSTKKKLIVAVVCLLVATCSLVTGTLAWLTTKTDPITNTFTTSDINITLDEGDDLDLKMVPSATIDKDPVVTVKGGSEACWLFVKIDKSANFDTFMTYAMADNWIQLKDTNGNDVVGVYYRAVPTSAVDQAFEVLRDNQVTVLETVTKAQMNGLVADNPATTDINESTYPTLTFTAYACQQVKGTGEFTPAEAWDQVKDLSTTNP